VRGKNIGYSPTLPPFRRSGGSHDKDRLLGRIHTKPAAKKKSSLRRLQRIGALERRIILVRVTGHENTHLGSSCCTPFLLISHFAQARAEFTPTSR